ncbi:hypothetical protein D3C72_973930 [compost metagenome]
MEQLLPAGRQRACQQPDRRHDRDPRIAVALHLEQHHRAQRQRNRGQHLVGDAEQRPQGVDAAQWIDDALVQEVAPGRHAQARGQQVGDDVFRLFQGWHEAAQQVLQHEAAGTRARIDCRQDEQRFEQDGEVVPEGHHARAADGLMQDMRHADGQRGRPARARNDRAFADVLRGLDQVLRRHHEAPTGDHLCHLIRRGANDGGRAVHGVVDARLDHASRHQGHDGHERFHQHAAVTDVAGLHFVFDQLGRGARRNQRMEARHGAASDGDEQEREQVARPHRAGAVHELGQRGHLQLGRHHHDADRQADDGADLQEGRQVVARGQQQPHGQHGRDEAVDDQDPGQALAVEVEHRADDRMRGHVLAEGDGRHQAHEADDRDLADLARADVAQVHAHEERDGNGGGHREGAPRRMRQRLHHDQRQHGQDDHHDHEGAEQRDHARNLAQLGLHQVAQRTAVAASRDEQDREILHRAGEHHAGQDPQHAGQIAHLRGQHRADQRTRAGDGGEVVAEQHVLVGGHVVQAVVVLPCRRHARRVQLEHLARDEAAVITVCDQIYADGGNHHP